MGKWQILSLILTVFISLGISYFADFLLSKHSFILRLSILLKIPQFIRVLSKME